MRGNRPLALGGVLVSCLMGSCLVLGLLVFFSSPPSGSPQNQLRESWRKAASVHGDKHTHAHAGLHSDRSLFFSTSTDAVWAWCPGHHGRKGNTIRWWRRGQRQPNKQQKTKPTTTQRPSLHHPVVFPLYKGETSETLTVDYLWA